MSGQEQAVTERLVREFGAKAQGDGREARLVVARKPVHRDAGLKPGLMALQEHQQDRSCIEQQDQRALEADVGEPGFLAPQHAQQQNRRHQHGDQGGCPVGGLHRLVDRAVMEQVRRAEEHDLEGVAGLLNAENPLAENQMS